MNTESPVKDTLMRPLEALRISVTDRCNLRCTYCMPAEIFGEGFKFLPRSEILSFEELTRVAEAFVALGVQKIRITGGEPLLRRDLHRLIRSIREIATHLDLSLTTNGQLLERNLEFLKSAGLDRINVSLDALDSEVGSQMAGRPVDPAHVWKAVEAARDINIETKVNMVIRRGINENEILPMANRCREAGLELRFIEFMDVGTTNEWNLKEVITGREVRERIHARWTLDSPVPQPFSSTARVFSYEDGAGRVGFINSISEPFCMGCNRARLTADGHLHTCLFSGKGKALKPWLRDERISTEELSDRLVGVWHHREDRYSEERHEKADTFRSRPEMWTIGG